MKREGSFDLKLHQSEIGTQKLLRRLCPSNPFELCCLHMSEGQQYPDFASWKLGLKASHYVQLLEAPSGCQDLLQLLQMSWGQAL